MQVKTNYINIYKNLSLMHASYATLQEFLQTVHNVTQLRQQSFRIL